MKIRVTETLHRQITELRGSKAAVKGGVMFAPRMLSIEEWEAEAQPQQRELMEWSMYTHGGVQVREPMPEPMQAHEERAFVSSMHQQRHSGRSEEEKAARAYHANRTVR